MDQFGDRTLRNQDISALVEGCACVITWIRLIQERHNINTYLCIIAIYAYLAITNQILNCVNSYVIRITNCQIRTLGHAKSRFFGAFNSLYSKVGRLASEEVILSLLQSKRLPILLYTTEVCPLRYVRCYCAIDSHWNLLLREFLWKYIVLAPLLLLKIASVILIFCPFSHGLMVNSKIFAEVCCKWKQFVFTICSKCCKSFETCCTHVVFYSLPVLCLVCLFICLFDFPFLLLKIFLFCCWFYEKDKY